MYKKLIYLTVVLTIFISMNVSTLSGSAARGRTRFADVTENHSWAYDAINSLESRGAISGVDGLSFAPDNPVTKEQFAKMLASALQLNGGASGYYRDVEENRWSATYISSTADFFYNEGLNFNPDKNMSREECAYTIANALGYGSNTANLLDSSVLESNFTDAGAVNRVLRSAVAMTVERGIIKGSDMLLRPDGEVTRAEAAVILYRAIQYKDRNSQDLFITRTPMIGQSTVSLEQAKRWATARGAHQRFIDIADLYWKYGELTGVRPEILYAQAAKETAYGKYTGQVKPEQNNWAGIKIKNPVADRPEDHESFPTPEDGVRAHFNHISQYVGLAPIGQPHDRYYVLNSMSWRGTVKCAEQLGGKWAPDVTYGYNIVVKLLRQMENTQ